VNLHSRIASRVLWQVAKARYRHEEDIYRVVSALPWKDWFEPDRTIRVDVSATRSPLESLGFVTLRIKDAVCDAMRRLAGRRPDVDTRHPDVHIQGYLTDREFTLYLDTTGEPLFKRGNRKAAGDAPLRENLAAGILRLADWQPGVTLLDPMCGGGTILIEAAQIALDIAPGSARHFAFEKLKRFDRGQWRELLRRSSARPRPKTPLHICGSDVSREALQAARANLAAAGLEDRVTLQRANMLELSAPASRGTMVTNPPYGVRLGEQQKLAELYPNFGDLLKRNFTGWHVYLLSADMRLPKLIGLAASKRIPLFNGALECRLFEYKIVEGSMRRKKRSE
jgi:putative N6-adenine-specific DNA methylase